jgi:F-type H+-transporting ATPase subunit epsilon
MKLKVLLPASVFIEADVTKVIAEAENGSFGILPRHIDFVAALVPGILSFEWADGRGEEFAAVDEGILVKCGADVTVAIRKAVRSKDLGELRRMVEEEFKVLDEQEKRTRSILARLETDFVRRMVRLG